MLVLLCISLIAQDVAAQAFSENDWKVIRSLSPAVIQLDTTNAFANSKEAAMLGQHLFFDKRLSSNGEVSCATCHIPEKYFTDGLSVSQGIKPLERNSTTLLNAAHQRWFFWDGRTDTLWGQPIETIEHPDEMNSGRTDVLRIIKQDDILHKQWERVFGAMNAQTEDQNTAMLAKSIAAYITQLSAIDAPFDAFVRGDNSAISESAKRGLHFFITDGGCLRCHFGPWFTDGSFHSVGVPPLNGGPLKDSGRYGAIDQLKRAEFGAGSEFSDDKDGMRATITKHIAKRKDDWGAFRTPSLRNVAKTPPFMHAGQLTTLDDVIEHYSTLENFVSADHHRETILVPLNMTELQKKDLKAFLESLTAPLPDDALLKDPR
ncbi:MAG: hypothetical protein CMA02_03425 [Euryarchaeota archaeon]|nr:hypothetical protein [Euryarchaeota archaeon]